MMVLMSQHFYVRMAQLWIVAASFESLNSFVFRKFTRHSANMRYITLLEF